MNSRRVVEDLLGHPLGDAQWEAVTAPAEPAAIVAGAGSGKTTVMSARVLWLVLEGYAAPDEVLGLTFTTKAAAELLGRTRSLLARARREGLIDDGGDPVVSTYHAFAARLLVDHGVRVGLEPGAEVLSDGARQALAGRVVRSTSLPLADLESSPFSLVKAVMDLDDRLAELDLTPSQVLADAIGLIEDLRGRDQLRPLQSIGRDMLDAARVRAALAGLVTEFREAKVRCQAVDFADQVRWALSLVRDSADVRRDLRAQARFVLLDEYQDTSVAQRILLQEAFGGGHPVTAVGDPCQAIYEWRGASVDNIDRFPEHFPCADGRPALRYSLAENRRSGPWILDLANEVAAPLRAIHPGVEPLASASVGKGAGVVRCALFETSAAEIEWIADEVVRLGEQGAWSDITVLARKADILADVHRALRMRQVPSELAGKAPLLDVPVVAEVRAVLEVLDDPTANASAVRLLAGPRWRLGPRDLAALGRLAGGGTRSMGDRSVDRVLREAVLGSDPTERASLLEAAERAEHEGDDLSPQARQRLARFAAEMRMLRRHRDEHPVELIGRVLRVTGLGVEMGIGHEVDVIDNARAMSAFRDLAARFHDDDDRPGSLSGRAGLGAFLARLRDAEAYDAAPNVELPPAGNAVRLMTIHKAKGLENTHVLIPGMCSGVFPSDHGRSRWPKSAPVVPWHLRDDAPPQVLGFPDPAEGPRDKDWKAFQAASVALEQDEERRLAYVALTRAERTLTVSGHWWGPTQSTARGPGPFLQEVHDWCQQGEGQIVSWAPPPADDDANPQLVDRVVPWPAAPDPVAELARRHAAQAVLAAVADPVLTSSGPDDHPVVRSWDEAIDRLVAEMRRERGVIDVALPARLSASDLVRLQDDPEEFARDLARPMPRRPHAGARRGTALHAWIEGRFAAQPLIEREALPGAADDIADDAELLRLRDAFLRTEYADLAPVAVEEPFAIALAGRLVRGRIDAVFARADRFEVVDWKTGGSGGVRDLQLAIYRLAWSEQTGTPLERIDGAFVMVSSGQVIRPTRWPSRAEIERLLAGG